MWRLVDDFLEEKIYPARAPSEKVPGRCFLCPTRPTWVMVLSCPGALCHPAPRAVRPHHICRCNVPLLRLLTTLAVFFLKVFSMVFGGLSAKSCFYRLAHSFPPPALKLVWLSPPPTNHAPCSPQPLRVLNPPKNFSFGGTQGPLRFFSLTFVSCFMVGT